MSLRSTAKTGLRTLVAAAAPGLWALRRAPRLLILTYHRVLPFDHPARRYEQAGMVVSPDTLAMNIAVLKEHFELLQVDEWIERAAQGMALPRLACALTFDDGWRDNYQFAYPVLQTARAPATIYLVSRMIGVAQDFWPTQVARLLFNSWTTGQRETPRALATLCGDVRIPEIVPSGREREAADKAVMQLKLRFADAQMKEMIRTLGSEFQDHSVSSELLDWREILEMAQSKLIRYGSHTCTHTRLNKIVDSSVVRMEVNESADELATKLSQPIRGFCYPNGDYSAEALALVRTKYRYAVTTRRGWNSTATDKFLLKRIGIHDDVATSRSRFLARIALGR